MAAALDKLLEDMLKDAGHPELDLFSVRNLTEKEKVQRSVNGLNAVVGDMDKSVYDCPICMNKGVVFMVEKRGDGYYETAQRCKCMNIRRDVTNIRNSGIEPSFRNYSFKSFTTAEDWQKAFLCKAVDFARKASSQEHKCFYVGGKSGTGKTHLCTAIMKHFILGEKKEAKYMLWVDETASIKALVNTQEYDVKIDAYRKVQVLYIDDFLKCDGRPTAADIRIAYKIINYRYQNPELITIISSERHIDDVIGIDEAVGSRIAEMCGEYVLSIGDLCSNYRLRSKK